MNLNPFVIFLAQIIDLYSLLLIVWIIMSWLTAFNILNKNQYLVSRISYFLEAITDPVIRPIRKYLPPFGGIDISPIFLFLFLNLLKNILITYFYTPY